MSQVELVHDLVVVVAVSRLVVAREERGVGAFEEDDPSAVLVEIRVLRGNVEAVLPVRDDFSGVGPRSDRPVGLRRCDMTSITRVASVTCTVLPSYVGAILTAVC